MAMVSKVPYQLAGKYAERARFEHMQGPGDSRPTGLEIVRDESLVDAWPDKVLLITGVSSGMGVETVKALLATGATVYGTARNLGKAKEALATELATGRVHLLHMDQTDFASVRACAGEFLKQSSKLNGLIGSAAVMNIPEGRTKDGFETQLGTNFLSHFLLFNLLRDVLIASATPDFKSRVVMVTSAAHRYAPFNFENPNFEGEYNGWLAYGSSKTAELYLVNQIQRLYGTQGLASYAVHPGAFESPNLQAHSSAEMQGMRNDPRLSKYMCSMEQACATSVYGATAEELEGKGGIYLEAASTTIHPCPADGDGVEYGYATWAYDQKNEERLWGMAKEWVKLE